MVKNTAAFDADYVQYVLGQVLAVRFVNAVHSRRPDGTVAAQVGGFCPCYRNSNAVGSSRSEFMRYSYSEGLCRAYKTRSGTSVSIAVS